MYLIYRLLKLIFFTFTANFRNPLRPYRHLITGGLISVSIAPIFTSFSCSFLRRVFSHWDLLMFAEGLMGFSALCALYYFIKFRQLRVEGSRLARYLLNRYQLHKVTQGLLVTRFNLVVIFFERRFPRLRLTLTLFNTKLSTLFNKRISPLSQPKLTQRKNLD